MYHGLPEIIYRLAIEDILDEARELGGLRDMEALMRLKRQGLSVYGQMPHNARATRQQIEALAQRIKTLPMPTVDIPRDRPIPTGPDWVAALPAEPEAITLSDLHYTMPLADALTES